MHTVTEITDDRLQEVVDYLNKMYNTLFTIEDIKQYITDLKLLEEIFDDTYRDTAPREGLINQLCLGKTGMVWPLNGDSEEYFNTFMIAAENSNMIHKNIIYIYCDGGCRVHSSKTGGYGIVLKYLHHEKHIYGYQENTTNNQMELVAAIKSLQAIHLKDIKTIVTMDSKYVIDGISIWIENWVKNNWRNSNKKQVKNADLWKVLYEEKNKFSNIEFIHCYGHADNVYNNKADQLATMAVDTLTSGVKEITKEKLQ